jgi:FixJ family two-component response regulator
MTSADDVTVFIINEDARVCAAMERPLKSVGLHVEPFATLHEFLRRNADRKFPNTR